jgi:hypothetical protein
MAGVNKVQIDVPKKAAAGELPIDRIIVTVQVENETAVTFKVTDPEGHARTFAALAPPPQGPPSDLQTFQPTWSTTQNTVIIQRPPNSCSIPGDPCRRTYTVNFLLDGDEDPNQSCKDVTPGQTQWTIEVVSGPNILSACVQSLDQNQPGNQCVGNVRNVPTTEPVANVDQAVAPPQGCSVRPGVDVVLVLDKSGSMADSALGGDNKAKILHLQDAVSALVNRWVSLRSAESANGTVNPDKIAVELFDSTAAAWTAIPDALDNFDSFEATILAQVGTITPGTATSIGSGVLRAVTTLAPDITDPTRRRVILVMSDGMQNTDPMIGVAPASSPLAGQVVTYSQNTPNTLTALANQTNYQIFTVTVGTSSAISPQVNQDVAKATNAFYVNSETDGSLMSPFFLELLGSFVKFNSWDIDRLIHATTGRGTPYLTTVPFTSTTRNVAMSLTWPPESGPLMLTVTPPGETQPTVANGFEPFVSDFTIPTSSSYDYTGIWQVRVEPGFFEPDIAREVPVARDVANAAAAAENPTIPFDLTILSEDSGLHSELRVVPNDYVPGDQVQFEMRLTSFGQSVTGVGKQGGDRMLVEVVKPGIGIGDLLSTSTAPTTQPFPSDPATAADAKLRNQVQADPNSLVRQSGDVIALTEVGDGLYRGSYGVQAPGHYNFLFGIEGGAPHVGRFSRQRLETVYVRPAPATTTTTVQTTFATVAGGVQMVNTFTPRTSLNHHLGPGWANYFWYVAPGQAPVKAQDNLDGTYTARIPITSPNSLLASLHFINVSLVIGDDCTPDNLPVPLDDSNVVVSPTDQIIRLVKDKFDVIEDFLEARIPVWEKLEQFLQSLFK